MGILLDDILEITLVQTLQTNQALNVFQFGVDELIETTTYEIVADHFEAAVVAAINDVQSTQVANTRLQIKNLTNGIDIYEKPLSGGGSYAGVAMPNFVAWAFRLVRTTGLTRHGAKRIVGPSEEAVGNNEPSTPAVALLNALATQLASPLVIVDTPGDLTIHPVIVGRVTTPGAGYGSYDLSKINKVQSAQFIRVTSQTSRRLGRGI